ncbi:exonuclease [Neptunitalea sp. Y10]|uniref:Exonuclease n=1 Tax=Neptunitalea lumnitzerae TaxID=2965509 RepID=A0ABQ5MFB9_9FLAO|nr:exonuclease [Neptunitalea sp. Y10]
MNAQTTNDTRLIQLQIDNDVLAPYDEDNYYTSGLFLAYRQSASNFLWWHAQPGENLFINADIKHQMYVPLYPNSEYLRGYDRPFAGWLATGLKINKISEKNVWLYGIALGVTGEASRAKELHQGFHDFAGVSENPLWIDQIPSGLMGNVEFGYGYLWNPSVLWTSKTVVGTKDVYLETGLTGLYNISYKEYLMPTTPKWFLMVGADYRLVGYDALLQGSVWNNDAPLTRDPSRNMLFCKLGVGWLGKGFSMQYVFNTTTKRTEKAQNHTYGTLIFQFRL